MKKTAKVMAEKKGIDKDVAIFMDNANDGDYDGIVEIYTNYHNHEKLLTYKNQRAAATALHLAANNGHVEIVQFLVNKICMDFPAQRSDLINAKNKFFFTPLICACFRGYLTKGKANECQDERLEIVRCLLQNGADVAYATPDTHMTAAHWAAYNKDENVVRELLRSGAPHGKFSHMDRLPIDVAGSSRAFDCVDKFLNSYYGKIKEQELLVGSRNRRSFSHLNVT